jgi:hypothetical protein
MARGQPCRHALGLGKASKKRAMQVRMVVLPLVRLHSTQQVMCIQGSG